MRTIHVKLTSCPYEIITGSGVLQSTGTRLRALKPGNAAYVVTNVRIKHAHGKTLSESLRRAGFVYTYKLVADSEKSKSFETARKLLQDLVLFDRNRQVFIIAFGGGVVGDLSGFVAAIYKRGIPYIQVPTTLLAQADSSIGGKTGLDLSQGKNLVGAFYQPRLVLADVSLLCTLTSRQIRSGLAEVIKYGIIRDTRLFTFLEKNYADILDMDRGSLEFIVERSAVIKATVVAQDERETKGVRTILNFGHTLGHAIEAAGCYRRYTHGEAIALGMLCACDISQRLNLVSDSTVARIENVIRKVGLPCRIHGVSLKSIINAHYRDKKFIGFTNRFVLLTGIGEVKIVKNVPLAVIKEVVMTRMPKVRH